MAMRFLTFLRLFTVGALWLLVPLSGQSQAQTTRQSGVLILMLNKGNYDQAIEQASTWIQEAGNQTGALDPAVYYYRGLAEFHIGWFGQSKRDMSAAAQAGVQVRSDSPQKIIAQIEAMEAVLPSQMQEIGEGDTTYFRVYYNNNDTTTNVLLKALPIAYHVDAEMYNAYVANQLILIFDTPEAVDAYERARAGDGQFTGASKYALAFSDGAALVFCGWKMKDMSALDITGTVTHEYNHCVLRRAMGNVELPSWFVEGIAEYAKNQVAPTTQERNDLDVARLVTTNALVQPQKLEDHDSFLESTKLGLEMGRAGQGGAPSPYAQGYHMTRFLLENMGDVQLPDFLNKVRDTASFNSALQATFNMSLTQFYGLWYQDMMRQIGKN